jgi:hypothetical protein
VWAHDNAVDPATNAAALNLVKELGFDWIRKVLQGRFG